MLKKYISIVIALFLIMPFLAACTQIDTPVPPVIPATVITPTEIPATPTAVVTTYEQALPLFDYDSSTPFDMTVLSEKEENGVIIQDLTFTAANPEYTRQTAGKIVAYLVKPSKSGSYAAVLYMHGLGPGWGDREEFLDESVKLAQQGVVSLLPAGLFPWMVPHAGDAELDKMNVINQVIELRRCIDFLLSQPGVDPQRIAYVGHDYGAMHGAVLSGVEKRIKTYTLMAGDDNYSDWSIAYFLKPKNNDAYRASMVAVDPVTYLPHAAPASLYFQFGAKDDFIFKESIDQSFTAGSEPKKIRLYEKAGHTLNNQAEQERLGWLAIELNLKPSTAATFILSSPKLAEGQTIPDEYTLLGANISPPLAWTEPPAGTQSLAIIVIDPTAGWTHWALYNIPPSTRELKEALPIALQLSDGSLQVQNSYGDPGYGGPGSPSKNIPLVFTIYALDIMLTMPAIEFPFQVVDVMRGRILATSELTVKFHH